MSSTPSRTMTPGTQQETVTDVDTLLGALEDDDCRSILEATSEQALSTNELCEQCDLSTSSAYRKVDILTDAGLLEESVRVSPSKSHKSEYRLAVDHLEITLGSSGVEVSVTERDRGRPLLSAD